MGSYLTMDFTIPEEVAAVGDALLKFIDREIVPLERDHAHLLSSERRLFDESGRYVPEVLALRKQVRMRSAELGFYNKVAGKKQLSDIIWRCFQTVGQHETVLALDRLKCFSRSSLEFTRRDRTDTIGFLACCAISGAIIALFWALPLGVLFAFAGTMLHQVRANDPAQTQLGLIVALIMTASIALGLRLMRRSRGALYLLTAGLSATIFWLSQRQPGGELFIPGNDIGTFWAFGSIGICAFIILFPRVQPGAWRRSSRGHR